MRRIRFRLSYTVTILFCCRYLYAPILSGSLCPDSSRSHGLRHLVVAFPCSGARDLINLDNGIVCDDFTVEALQKGILQAMQKSYDKDTIIRDLRRRFSYDVIARQYLTLYRKILQQHEP